MDGKCGRVLPRNSTPLVRCGFCGIFMGLTEFFTVQCGFWRNPHRVHHWEHCSAGEVCNHMNVSSQTIYSRFQQFAKIKNPTFTCSLPPLPVSSIPVYECCGGRIWKKIAFLPSILRRTEMLTRRELGILGRGCKHREARNHFRTSARSAMICDRWAKVRGFSIRCGNHLAGVICCNCMASGLRAQPVHAPRSP